MWLLYGWSPHFQYQTYQLEKVQRNAARFVMNDFSRFSSVTRMLEYLSWPSLEQRRKYFKLLMLFKSLSCWNSIIYFNSTSFTYSQPLSSIHHSTRTESYLHSFLPSVVKLWNNLPQSLIEIDNIDDFKQALEYYLAISLISCMIICVLYTLLEVLHSNNNIIIIIEQYHASTRYHSLDHSKSV